MLLRGAKQRQREQPRGRIDEVRPATEVDVEGDEVGQGRGDHVGLPLLGGPAQGVLGRLAPACLTLEHAHRQCTSRRIHTRLDAFPQLRRPQRPAVLDEQPYRVEQERFRLLTHGFDGRGPQQVLRRPWALAASRRAEVGRQRRVEAIGCGHPVCERLFTTEKPGRSLVQLPQAGGRQIVPDSNAVERMGEAQLGIGAHPPGHEARSQQIVQSRRRIGDVRDRADHRQRGRPADHSKSHRQLPSCRWQNRKSGDERRGQGAGRGEVAVALDQTGGLQLGEQSAHVQRVPAGVAVQPLGGPGGQHHPGSRRQRADLRHRQRPDLDAGAPAGVQAQPFPAVGDGVEPARHDQQDAVAAQPFRGGQQGLAGGTVGPVEVLDDNRHRGVSGRPTVHQLEPRRERGRRDEVGQLPDHVERNLGPQLVGLGPHDGEPGRQRLHRPIQQGGLPRPRLALDPDQPGPALEGVLGATPQHGQLCVAADEHRIIKGHDPCLPVPALRHQHPREPAVRRTRPRGCAVGARRQRGG